MPHAERSVVIARPMAEVFAFFADFEHDPQWRSHVREIRRQGPIAVGTRYRQRIAGPGGRPIAADVEVTAYEPDTRVAFQVVAGPARPRGEYLLRPAGTGTEVTMRLDAELTGWKKLLMARPVQRSMESEVAGLDRAKAILESST